MLVDISCEDYFWNKSETEYSNTTFAEVVKMELLHKSLDSILRPLCIARQAGFKCIDKPEENLQCCQMVAALSTDALEQKDLSPLMHGFQTVKQYYQYVCDEVNIKSGRQYNSWSVFEAIKRRNISTKLGKRRNFSFLEKDIQNARVEKENRGYLGEKFLVCVYIIL